MTWAGLVAWWAANGPIVGFLGVWVLDYTSGIWLARVRGEFRASRLLVGLAKLSWLVPLLILRALVDAGVAAIDDVPVQVIALWPLRLLGRSFMQNVHALGMDFRLPPGLASKRPAP